MRPNFGTVASMSPRESEPEVTDFARLIADALANVISERGISKRELARMISRSNNYVAMRFRHEAAFTLTDVDMICSALGLDAGSFIAGIRIPPTNVTPLRQRDVLPQTEDEIDIVDAPRKSEHALAADEGDVAADQPHAE